MFRSLFLVLVFFSFQTPAHAYLDPGAGSMVLQSILAAASALIVGAGYYSQRITQFFRKSKDGGQKPGE